jgi:dienelactone hydrolase
MNPRIVLTVAAALAAGAPPGPAQAAIAPSLHAAANCVAFDAAPLDYVFCDDGVPAAGGASANATGALAITVPAEYGGDGYTGLPPKKLPTTVPGADAAGDVALDVDITWPRSAPPAGGYPLLVFMHGCCSGNKTSWESGTKATAGDFAAAGEKWHYNNAWFASRGYVVITYTARGFATNGPTGPNRAGSTGETQLDSRRFEVNDFQSLACQVYGAAGRWDAVLGQAVSINPEKVVVTGGSYGGGFSWMALTDPIWTCTADTGAAGQRMKLAAVAPRYGWTDLLYSLVPTGRHSGQPGALPRTDGCDSGPRRVDGSLCADAVPVGVPKQTINAGLYGTGLSGATFPASIHQAQACLTGAYPVDPANPSCTSTVETTLPEFLRERSAYYQQHWFDRIVSDPEYRIPVFSAGTLTDPLFPALEHRRMHNRIRSLVPGYPLQAYFGDYQHFVQNKPKEWADLCGADRHACTNADYAGDFDRAPSTLARTGVTTRLNRFIDYYAQPLPLPLGAPPPLDVTAALQVCPQKAGPGQPADEPGETYSAATFEALATGVRVLDSGGATPSLTAGPTGMVLTAGAGGGAHADPVATSQMANKCSTRAAGDPAPAGVAQLTSAALESDLVMLGAGRLTATFAPSGDSGSVQLNARLYELLPDGSAVLADRGFRRLAAAEVAIGSVTFDLSGNGWKFTQGNRIRLELAQDDSPYLKASQPPSSLALGRVTLSLPVRTSGGGAGPGGGGGAVGGGGGGGAPALALLGGLLGLAVLRRRRR